MHWILIIAGGGWAFFGLLNIVLMPWDTGSDVLLSGGLILNGLAFVLPGLICFGVGVMMHNSTRANAPPQPAPQQNEPTTPAYEEPPGAAQRIANNFVMPGFMIAGAIAVILLVTTADISRPGAGSPNWYAHEEIAVYAGPGKEYEIVRHLQPGVAVQFMDRKPGWRRIGPGEWVIFDAVRATPPR